MKRSRFSALSAIVSLPFLFFLNGSKKEEAPDNNTPASKIGKAFGNDGTVEKQVCSSAEEQDFRSHNAGKEISCR